MIPDPVFVSFYTPAYEEEARGLCETLRRWGLEQDVRALPPRGLWVENCAQKPAFLLSMLEHHKRPVCWIDADARVLKRPDMLLDGNMDGIDLAITRWEWPHSPGVVELLTGLVHVGDTPNARRIVGAWRDACAKTPQDWDQRVLARVLPEQQERCVRYLPLEYCWIFDLFIRHYGPDREPVVVQMQASRRLKPLSDAEVPAP